MWVPRPSRATAAGQYPAPFARLLDVCRSSPRPSIGTARRPPYAEPHEPTFEWVGESLRHAGTVVHAFLQRMLGVDAGPPICL